MKQDSVDRLRSFLENEMRSCSMDIGGITPEYVERMWGGNVPLNEIHEAFKALATECRAKAEMEVLKLTSNSKKLH